MTTTEKVQLPENSDGEPSSHEAASNSQMKSPPYPYAFALQHIGKTFPPYFQSPEKSAELLATMRTISPTNTFHTDFWKGFLFQKLPERIQSLVVDNLHTYTGDQLAHMADIIYERMYGCSDYRFYITDQISGAKFLIGTGSSHSTIPKKNLERFLNKQEDLLKKSKHEGMEAHGVREMSVNFSTGRVLRWNFYVTDVPTPIIGADFLAYYNLVLDLKNRKLIDNHYKPTLFGPEHDDTMYYNWSEVETVRDKVTKNLDGHESPSENLNVMSRFVKWDALRDDIWKSCFLSMLTESVQENLKDKITSCTIGELAFQGDCIHNEHHHDNNHRLFVTDSISHMAYLVDSGSHFSQIPNDGISPPIPFSRIVRLNGSDLIEYGQKCITLGSGGNETLTWNFVMTDTPIPIIGADFLTYYELLVDLRRKRLFRSAKF
ncbi:unnamed protein product [Rodentolepis nana]|uniref:Peptidase A2 domain-containing protein n=1 Tax=Rodentolepis nana TaxID=102285 RepID=A0A0R3T2J7_RODNA|nr:unnamed protein product [Rodentolepis nana]